MFNEEIEIDFQDIDPKDQELFEDPSKGKTVDNENNEDNNSNNFGGYGKNKDTNE